MWNPSLEQSTLHKPQETSLPSYFSRLPAPRLTFQLNKDFHNPIEKPKKKKKTDSFPQRVHLIPENLIISDPIKALNQRIKTRNYSFFQSEYDKAFFTTHKNKPASDRPALAEYEVAVSAFRIYSEKISQRIQIIQAYSDKQYNSEQSRQELQNIQNLKKLEINSGSDITKYFQTFNKISAQEHKKQSIFQKNLQKERIPSYIFSLQTLQSALKITKLPWQLRSEAHQKTVDTYYHNLRKDNPSLYILTSVGTTAVNTVNNFARDILSTLHLVFLPLMDEQARHSQRDLFNRWQIATTFWVSTDQKTSLRSPSSGRTFTAGNFTQLLTSSVINMATLLTGAGAVWKLSSSAGAKIWLNVSQNIAYKTGLVSTAFAQQMWNSFDEALSMGLTSEQAFGYSFLSSITQSGLELLSPNMMMTKAWQQAAKSYIKPLFSSNSKQGFLSAFKSFSKLIWKEILEENFQEVAQLDISIAINQRANGRRNADFWTDFTWQNFTHTALLTTLTTWIMAWRASNINIRDINNKTKSWLLRIIDKINNKQIKITGLNMDNLQIVENQLKMLSVTPIKPIHPVSPILDAKTAYDNKHLDKNIDKITYSQIDRFTPQTTSEKEIILENQNNPYNQLKKENPALSRAKYLSSQQPENNSSNQNNNYPDQNDHLFSQKHTELLQQHYENTYRAAEIITNIENYIYQMGELKDPEKVKNDILIRNNEKISALPSEIQSQITDRLDLVLQNIILIDHIIKYKSDLLKNKIKSIAKINDTADFSWKLTFKRVGAWLSVIVHDKGDFSRIYAEGQTNQKAYDIKWFTYLTDIPISFINNSIWETSKTIAHEWRHSDNLYIFPETIKNRWKLTANQVLSITSNEITAYMKQWASFAEIEHILTDNDWPYNYYNDPNSPERKQLKSKIANLISIAQHLELSSTDRNILINQLSITPFYQRDRLRDYLEIKQKKEILKKTEKDKKAIDALMKTLSKSPPYNK